MEKSTIVRYRLFTHLKQTIYLLEGNLKGHCINFFFICDEAIYDIIPKFV